MYFVLYDKNMNPIGDTYILEDWSRIQRAVDYDALDIIGEQIPYFLNPVFVVANNHRGNMLFSGLASTPEINYKEKKTKIVLKDYMTLFNTEVILDWGIFDGTSLSQYIDFILWNWKTQTGVGDIFIWDSTDLTELALDEDIPLGSSKESVLVSSLIFDALKYYDIFCETKVDLYKRSVTFLFKRSKRNTVSLRLSDFGVQDIEKSFGEYNRACILRPDFTKFSEWALTDDNQVVLLPSQKITLYPPKKRNFVAKDEKVDSINDATYDAVMGLANNRYQENIDIDAQQYKSIIDLTSLDFSWMVTAYFEDGQVRELPVGEIETNSKGKHIIRLGHRIQELTQEL